MVAAASGRTVSRCLWASSKQNAPRGAYLLDACHSASDPEGDTHATTSAQLTLAISELIDRGDDAIAEAGEVIDPVVVSAAIEDSQACGQRQVGIELIAHLRREIHGSALG